MEQKENALLLSLGARYYFLSENKLKPFLGLEAGMETTKVTTTGSSEIKYNVSGLGGEIGCAYFINQHGGMEAFYQYTKMNYKENDDHPLTEDLAEAREPRTREMLQRQIADTDTQIDQLVYGLTEEEIRIVEEE